MVVERRDRNYSLSSGSSRDHSRRGTTYDVSSLSGEDVRLLTSPIMIKIAENDLPLKRIPCPQQIKLKKYDPKFVNGKAHSDNSSYYHSISADCHVGSRRHGYQTSADLTAPRNSKTESSSKYFSHGGRSPDSKRPESPHSSFNANSYKISPAHEDLTCHRCWARLGPKVRGSSQLAVASDPEGEELDGRCINCQPDYNDPESCLLWPEPVRRQMGFRATKCEQTGHRKNRGGLNGDSILDRRYASSPTASSLVSEVPSFSASPIPPQQRNGHSQSNNRFIRGPAYPNQICTLGNLDYRSSSPNNLNSCEASGFHGGEKRDSLEKVFKDFDHDVAEYYGDGTCIGAPPYNSRNGSARHKSGSRAITPPPDPEKWEKRGNASNGYGSLKSPAVPYDYHDRHAGYKFFGNGVLDDKYATFTSNDRHGPDSNRHWRLLFEGEGIGGTEGGAGKLFKFGRRPPPPPPSLLSNDRDRYFTKSSDEGCRDRARGKEPGEENLFPTFNGLNSDERRSGNGDHDRDSLLCPESHRCNLISDRSPNPYYHDITQPLLGHGTLKDGHHRFGEVFDEETTMPHRNVFTTTYGGTTNLGDAADFSGNIDSESTPSTNSSVRSVNRRYDQHESREREEIIHPISTNGTPKHGIPRDNPGISGKFNGTGNEDRHSTKSSPKYLSDDQMLKKTNGFIPAHKTLSYWSSSVRDKSLTFTRPQLTPESNIVPGPSSFSFPINLNDLLSDAKCPDSLNKSEEIYGKINASKSVPPIDKKELSEEGLLPQLPKSCSNVSLTPPLSSFNIESSTGGTPLYLESNEKDPSKNVDSNPIVSANNSQLLSTKTPHINLGVGECALFPLAPPLPPPVSGRFTITFKTTDSELDKNEGSSVTGRDNLLSELKNKLRVVKSALELAKKVKSDDLDKSLDTNDRNGSNALAPSVITKPLAQGKAISFSRRNLNSLQTLPSHLTQFCGSETSNDSALINHPLKTIELTTDLEAINETSVLSVVNLPNIDFYGETVRGLIPDDITTQGRDTGKGVAVDFSDPSYLDNRSTYLTNALRESIGTVTKVNSDKIIPHSTLAQTNKMKVDIGTGGTISITDDICIVCDSGKLTVSPVVSPVHKSLQPQRRVKSAAKLTKSTMTTATSKPTFDVSVQCHMSSIPRDIDDEGVDDSIDLIDPSSCQDFVQSYQSYIAASGLGLCPDCSELVRCSAKKLANRRSRPKPPSLPPPSTPTPKLADVIQTCHSSASSSTSTASNRTFSVRGSPPSSTREQDLAPIHQITIDCATNNLDPKKFATFERNYLPKRTTASSDCSSRNEGEEDGRSSTSSFVSKERIDDMIKSLSEKRASFRLKRRNTIVGSDLSRYGRSPPGPDPKLTVDSQVGPLIDYECRTFTRSLTNPRIKKRTDPPELMVIPKPFQSSDSKESTKEAVRIKVSPIPKHSESHAIVPPSSNNPFGNFRYSLPNHRKCSESSLDSGAGKIGFSKPNHCQEPLLTNQVKTALQKPHLQTSPLGDRVTDSEKSGYCQEPLPLTDRRDIFGRFRHSLQNYRRKVVRDQPEDSSPDEAEADEGHYDLAANRIIMASSTLNASASTRDLDDAADRISERGHDRVYPLYEPIMEEPGDGYTINPELDKALRIINEYLTKPKECRLTEVTINNMKKLVSRHWFHMISNEAPKTPGSPGGQGSNTNQPTAVIAPPGNPVSASLIEFHLDHYESLSKELLRFVTNLTDGMGNTGIHYSISYGNFDVVSTLLDSKVCDVNVINDAGYTPIMLTALAKLDNTLHLEVIRRLYRSGDVNKRASQNGQTALMLAASHDSCHICRALLEFGADPNIRDNDGSTALMCAAEHGHITVAKCLLSQSDIDTSLVDNDGSTALSVAVKAGHKDIGILIYAHQNLLGSLHKKKSSMGSALDANNSSVHSNLNRQSQATGL